MDTPPSSPDGTLPPQVSPPDSPPASPSPPPSPPPPPPLLPPPPPPPTPPSTWRPKRFAPLVSSPLPSPEHEKKGEKRKREDESGDDKYMAAPLSRDAREALITRIIEQVKILQKTFSWNEVDRTSAQRATDVLAKLAKNEETVTLIVGSGAVPALIKHLQAPPLLTGDARSSRPLEHEVEKGCAYALGLLSVEPEHQQLIVDHGALSHLVDLLKRHKEGSATHAVNSLIRRATDAIANLAYDNSRIKIRVRNVGGILPLVELLNFDDSKVQRAAARALCTLATKDDENKNMIVKHNGLQTLIKMLGSDDAAICYEAVGVIENLVHSSPNIKKEVLSAGALQPVITLLKSRCPEIQREAALLLGQFAADDSDYRVDIVKSDDAVLPLIKMLRSPDVQLREMSAFALGRLTQDTHDQAGTAFVGALAPLLELLDSQVASLKHKAAFALYGLADKENYVFDFMREGGDQKLQHAQSIFRGATKDCVTKTLKRLEEKIRFVLDSRPT